MLQQIVSPYRFASLGLLEKALLSFWLRLHSFSAISPSLGGGSFNVLCMMLFKPLCWLWFLQGPFFYVPFECITCLWSKTLLAWLSLLWNGRGSSMRGALSPVDTITWWSAKPTWSHLSILLGASVLSASFSPFSGSPFNTLVPSWGISCRQPVGGSACVSNQRNTLQEGEHVSKASSC